MTLYQQTRLTDYSAIGGPEPLPYAVANWTDAQVADLDAAGLDPQFGLAGMGFWPVDVVAPAFDAGSQVLVPPTACGGVDTTARRWSATAAVRALTPAEVAALPIIDVPGDAIVGAMSRADRAKVDPFDVSRIAWRGDVPATNAKLKRMADALGTTPDALRRAGQQAG